MAEWFSVQEHWIWLAAGAGGLLILLLLVWLIRRRQKRLNTSEIGGDFERFCADLLEKCGYREVEMTPGSGDFGVDIFAVRDGVTWAFQCKCYDHPVGVRAVQEIYSGRDYYHCMVGVVMASTGFTQAAQKLAEAHNIVLWDGEFLERLRNRVS